MEKVQIIKKRNVKMKNNKIRDKNNKINKDTYKKC